MTLFSRKEKENANTDNIKEEKASTLGSRISELRKQKGYTQEDFSQLLGVTAQAVSKWENDVSCPDIMLLPKIAQLLGTTTDELLSGAPAKASESKPAPADLSKLSLNIRVTSDSKKPVNVSLPLTMVKKFTKLGTGISNIVNVGSASLNSSQIDSIFELIDEGVTGEILNVTDENGQHVVIEIN